MPRCRSTTGSAAPPASAARRRSPTARRRTTLERKVTVRFDANVAPGLPWKFEPEQNVDRSASSARSSTVYYTRHQPGGARDHRQATYNVTPLTVGAYFTKINCFCFTEQTHAPGRDARDAGRVLRRSGARARTPSRTTSTPSRLSYTFYAGASSRRGRSRKRLQPIAGRTRSPKRCGRTRLARVRPGEH